MKIWRKALLFYLGGCAYMVLELLWRGWTHGSMFLAGGLCFLLIGEMPGPLPLPARGVLGALVITAVELGMGLAVNRSYQVWDYRGIPGNLWGQICPLFTLLWIPAALAAAGMYRFLDGRIKAFPSGEGGTV